MENCNIKTLREHRQSDKNYEHRRKEKLILKKNMSQTSRRFCRMKDF